MALFLVWHDEESAIEPERLLALDRFELSPGLMLVDSPLRLSPLYHSIKWARPGATSLLVAPLAAAPKFKALEPGALKWIGSRSD